MVSVVAGVERVDGQWTQWTGWSECPVTCGGASVNRERTCSNPAPSGGGRPCTDRDLDAGHLTTRETQGMQCALDVCPSECPVVDQGRFYCN